ncbi:NAD(P)-dependent dehydrogenase (short-subunit alcohol dehydrogenase family) [Sphingobium sp. B2D3A]|uniref:SDR family oxidoreductase n=1 Tax=unclassified Sphingobium TaxID=2611147 RepID=UPI0022258F21|nr:MULTISPECIES: SDR family oxidoreductase [unclassified Sphingobium]MCW2338427.1 NAD(P)-dependent dehydrogenase (short-subunit alcohol dehydrogenase family) [Sphingobium sp. B2D3A]MCW2384885.1 NAD(P)-dependent dehydrogenase (short-subunit alcohol dehydrogenase family) [Sphingobium sp. B2D3D]
MKNFAGKVAFVTGGASGIGLGMARAFLAEGMKLVIADYNQDHLDAARDLMTGNNATHFIRVDVTDRAALRTAAQEALDVFGKIHLLANNAGVGGGGAADDPDFEDWDRTIGINLGGVVNGCKIIVPIIKAQGEGGHVINTASMAGMVPLPGAGAYAASKYAVRGYTQTLRLDLAPHGIGVSCLYPGAVQSALMPVPEDDSSAPPGEEGVFVKRFWAAMRAAMDPLEMGRLVVEAIRENRPHILTHSEFLPEMRAMHQDLETAFVTGLPVPEARSSFERFRHETVARLMAMDVID